MSSNNGSNIGFGGALTLLFIGLKLANFIHWSWWWVLSPLWIAVSLLVFLLLLKLFVILLRGKR